MRSVTVSSGSAARIGGVVVGGCDTVRDAAAGWLSLRCGVDCLGVEATRSSSGTGGGVMGGCCAGSRVWSAARVASGALVASVGKRVERLTLNACQGTGCRQRPVRVYG